MKSTEQYFPVVLFVKLLKVVLGFGSVNEILKYDRSMKALEKCHCLLCYTRWF